MSKPIADASLDTLFRNARSANAWTGEDISEATIRQVYEAAKLGPTTGNSCPGRFLFLKKGPARDRLVPLMSEGNRQKTADAPWTVLIAHDLEFYTAMPVLFPSRPAMFDAMKGNDAAIAQHVLRNGSLQGAYLMLAARAFGLDCGPMGGFDAAAVNREFFESDPEKRNWRINWICNIGHAQPSAFPRLPRLSFEEAAAIL
jgi:3-hydroxypropanoate dehydrogenase